MEHNWDTLHSTRWPSSRGIFTPLKGLTESKILPEKFLPPAHSGRTELAHPMHPAGMLKDRTGCKYGKGCSAALVCAGLQCLTNLTGSPFLCLATVPLALKLSPVSSASALTGFWDVSYSDVG